MSEEAKRGRMFFLLPLVDYFEDSFPKMSGFRQIRNSPFCILQTLSQGCRYYPVPPVRLEMEQLNYSRSSGLRPEGGGRLNGHVSRHCCE